jgi:hypothetical protein
MAALDLRGRFLLGGRHSSQIAADFPDEEFNRTRQQRLPWDCKRPVNLPSIDFDSRPTREPLDVQIQIGAISRVISIARLISEELVYKHYGARVSASLGLTKRASASCEELISDPFQSGAQALS